MKCRWTRQATKEYLKISSYIFNQFGRKSALDFVAGMEQWDEYLCSYPDLGSIELLLANRKRFTYRSICINRYNKLIYTISSDGTVTIIDIWDTRRNPKTLAKRIKPTTK